MTVTKRTRYEVLRRDGHTCRYCGGVAPDVALTVDHVVPVSLGGADDPGNLVAACRDCNAGKASSNPDAEVVSSIDDDVIRWAAALRQAAESMLSQRDELRDLTSGFSAHWKTWTTAGSPAPLPPGWRNSVERWLAAGLPMEILSDDIDIAMGRERVRWSEKFTYVAGIAWKQVTELQDAARKLIGNPGDYECPNCGELPDSCMAPWEADGRCGRCEQPKSADHSSCCATRTARDDGLFDGYITGYDKGKDFGFWLGGAARDLVAYVVDGDAPLSRIVAERVGIPVAPREEAPF